MTKEELKIEACKAIDARRDEIIAFADSVSSEPELGFKEVKTSEKFASLLKSLGREPRCNVAITGVVDDPTLGERIYRPGHPDADENGYIRTSNVNPMVEMADATMAQRAYEANLAVITISKSMASRATQIGQ